MQTLLYFKQITHKDLLCGILLSVMWRPGWEEALGVNRYGQMDAKSLHCSPETTTTLLIGCTPIQNQKFKIWGGEGEEG